SSSAPDRVIGNAVLDGQIPLRWQLHAWQQLACLDAACDVIGHLEIDELRRGRINRRMITHPGHARASLTCASSCQARQGLAWPCQGICIIAGMPSKDIPEIAEEFDGWEGWISLVGGQYHARLR